MFMSKLMALLFLPALFGCASVPQSTSAVNTNDLIGTWKVDLRPTPSAPAYFKEFVVTAIQGKTFTGSFYGAEITQGRLNTDWGAVRFAFVTADNSGPYNHSGVLKAGRIEGLTNSTGREFLAYWSAEKP
jgi:hypothetical protein